MVETVEEDQKEEEKKITNQEVTPINMFPESESENHPIIPPNSNATPAGEKQCHKNSSININNNESTNEYKAQHGYATVRKMFNQQIAVTIKQENHKYTPKKRLNNAQSDPGANISATNRLELIWNYRAYDTPRNIGTYSTPISAEGEGTIKIITEENDITDHIIHYIPTSSGTVISPDKFVTDNPDLYDEFAHIGRPKKNEGCLIFQGSKTRATLRLVRNNGLYYISNPILLPPQIPQWQLNTVTAGEQNLQQETQMSTKLKNLEIWHQRMGHPSNEALLQTQKSVEGIPALPTATPLFSCPFCDKAKMHKIPTNKKTKKRGLHPCALCSIALPICLRSPSVISKNQSRTWTYFGIVG